MGFVGFFLQFFVMQFFSSQAWTFHGVISCCSFKRFKMHARYSQGLWEKGLKSLYLKTYQPRKEGGWELKCKFQWMFAKTRISDLVLQMWKGKCYFRKRPQSVPSYPSMETRYRKEKEWRLWGKYRANKKNNWGPDAGEFGLLYQTFSLTIYLCLPVRGWWRKRWHTLTPVLEW